MPNLIQFLVRNRLVLLFVLFESIALLRILRTHSFHYSKYLYGVNILTGQIQSHTQNAYNYLSLREQNEDLMRENEDLKNRLQYLSERKSYEQIYDSTTSKYRFITAEIVHNSYRKQQNILTLNKGSKQGLKPDMGVVLPNGVVGIILQTSPHFSTVLSILNRQTGVNVKIKHTHYTGSLTWDAGDYRYVYIEDLPIQSNIQSGDTIVTGGKSLIFPEGIPVGIIESFNKKNKEYNQVRVRLLADFSSLYRVYVVKNLLSEEQRELESRNE
jgi:rod shape-determining protein MreC